jgi:hypothetical protein
MKAAIMHLATMMMETAVATPVRQDFLQTISVTGRAIRSATTPVVTTTAETAKFNQFDLDCKGCGLIPLV